ncbi:hypothetical protein LCGC14_1556910, partial [marine sediment metagenome]
MDGDEDEGGDEFHGGPFLDDLEALVFVGGAAAGASPEVAVDGHDEGDEAVDAFARFAAVGFDGADVVGVVALELDGVD